MFLANVSLNQTVANLAPLEKFRKVQIGIFFFLKLSLKKFSRSGWLVVALENFVREDKRWRRHLAIRRTFTKRILTNKPLQTNFCDQHGAMLRRDPRRGHHRFKLKLLSDPQSGLQSSNLQMLTSRRIEKSNWQIDLLGDHRRKFREH